MSGNLWYDGPVAVQALKAVLIVSIRHTKKSSEIPFYETEYIYSYRYSQWVSIAPPPRDPSGCLHRLSTCVGVLRSCSGAQLTRLMRIF